MEKELIFWLLIAFCLCGFIISFYILWRNGRMHSFLHNINDLNYKYAVRRINEHDYSKGDFDAIKITDYNNIIPSYNRLLFSFKPLRLETYFTQDEINELLEEK